MKRNEYSGKKLKAISFPLGGIGTGSIGLSGNGRLIDWEIFNRPNKGSDNGFSHFAVKTEKDNKVIDKRVLNGDLQGDFLGQYGKNFGHGISNVTMAGFPHFRECTFKGEYPIATVELNDSDFPGCAEIKAFNPLIPLNTKDSSIPCAMFSIRLKNATEDDLDYTVSAVLQNPRWNSVNKAFEEDGISGILLDNTDNEENINSLDMTVATDSDGEKCLEEYWFRGIWYDNIETYWRKMSSAGFPEKRTYSEPGRCDLATVFVKKHVKAGDTAEFRFVLSWNVPNFINDWIPKRDENGNEIREVMHLYYSYLFKNSADTAKYVLKNWDRLYGDTEKYRKALYSSTLPEEVIDAVASTTSVLKTATVLRLGENGDFYGWEGQSEHVGSCEGTCSHVYNYVYSTCFLFPDLERNIRENDYKYNQLPNGEMSFRVRIPFGREPGTNRACVDGLMGGIIKVYREWKISGDDEWLKSVWDSAKKSLEYAWRPDNQDKWDLDKDGVLEGRQHHTLDMELFGPSSWLEGFYLGALKAAVEISEYLGNTDDAAEYKKLFENGKKWTAENLFNGEYFIHKLDLNDYDFLKRYTEGTVDVFGRDATESYWNDETKEIKYQIGEGCEIDQLVAQWHADILGLGDLFDPDQVNTALKSMYKYNFKPSMRNVSNPFRVFALNDESGAIMCEFPENRRKPKIPILTSYETMHGFEYSLAGLLISRGFIDEGLSIVRGVRDRYDGEKRNPWNEIECGSNYSRSMSSFALLPIFAGLEFDLSKGHIGFAPKINRDNYKTVWSLGTAWGDVEITNNSCTVSIFDGTLGLNSIKLPFAPESVIVDGKETAFTLDGNTVLFNHKLQIKSKIEAK